MAETINRGPNLSIGALMGNVTTQAGSGVALIEPTDGPSAAYQGYGFPDVRYSPANKDGMKSARIPVFLGTDNIQLVDAIPQTLDDDNIVVAQATVAATPLTLVTTCIGGSVTGTYFSAGCPAIVPLRALPANTQSSFPNMGAAGALATYKSGSTTSVSGVLALDFGFSVGTIVAGSATVSSVPDTSLFYEGQWICIGGGGNSGKTTGLVTQVTAVGATTLTISPVSAASLTAAPIGSANYSGPFPAQGAADAVQPYVGAGTVAAFNPMEAISRVIRITASSASAVGGTFTVSGFDIYGQAMTETIVVVPATSVVKFGAKCWKYISSIIPTSTDAGFTIKVGTADVFGIHLLSQKWEHVQVSWDAIAMTTATGWVAAVRTSPATAATGDVRGSIQTGASGGGSGIGSTPSNGAIRLSISVSPTPWQHTSATPVNPIPMFGVQQA